MTITMDLVFLLHFLSTTFMTGVCWFVQIVHYPLFREVPIADFPKYQNKNFVTGYVTVPAMLIELFTGLWVIYLDYSALFLTNMLLLSLIWASTFTLQVPLHLKLAKAGNSKHISRLIATNWIRTIAWSIRSALLVYFVLYKL